MKLDPLKLKDWQIAEAAEDHMKPFAQLAAGMGLKAKELIPMGRRYQAHARHGFESGLP